METPFLRHGYYSPIPVQPTDCPRYYPLRNRQVPVQRQPKVVSIPVQDAAGSERRRSDSALKIQKAFRGFLVRKNVNKIAAIKREVDEMEMRISRKEMAELVRSDAKERLKVNETLMNLLLRLDSVKGVDPGVRESRRAVIKKAIALQERVDASAEPTTEMDSLSCNSQNSKEDEGGDDEEVVKTESNNKEENNLVERMVEENEKMMGLMRALLLRNEKQTGLLSSLSQRVEQLERALIDDRLKKKKKRNPPYCRNNSSRW
ncbi:hypothetical protein M0R45_021471 [Rubus argutus]|uniref:BAG domain-containing protein n=1 Tax=Rubus argutus TaxID=59490 RepID=A0AAW1XF13_RUBAR